MSTRTFPFILNFDTGDGSWLLFPEQHSGTQPGRGAEIEHRAHLAIVPVGEDLPHRIAGGVWKAVEERE